MVIYNFLSSCNKLPSWNIKLKNCQTETDFGQIFGNTFNPNII